MMIRKTLLSASLALTVAGGAMAAGGGGHTEDVAFSFEGPFGHYDRDQLQRGLQVYTEKCASCHGLSYVSFRDLEALGYSDEEVRAYAADFDVSDDGPDAAPGDTRAALPTDKFPGSQFEGAPDLSLMAKARAGFHGPVGLGINQITKGMGGPEYIYTLLISYEDVPACAEDSDIDGNYNTYFGGGGYAEECKDDNGGPTIGGTWFGMPQPLYGDDVEYQDGTEATLEQEAKDVAAFLMWTAEPKLEVRKKSGVVAVVFLTLLTVLLYLTNKKLWWPHKHRRKDG